MEQENGHVIGKCFGTTVVGPRGQLVIPVQARKELGIDAGHRLLVFGQIGGYGITFVKVEVAEQLLNIVSNRLDEVARLLKESKPPDAESQDEGS